LHELNVLTALGETCAKLGVGVGGVDEREQSNRASKDNGIPVLVHRYLLILQ
jgi:hypothetical protein